jgi:hypothetical protein
MNDIDVRDERLGQLLDRAVRDVQPRVDPATSVGRGRFRHAARLVASVAVVSVFVAALGWAATQIGDRTGPSPLAAIGSIEENGWTATYPSSWHVTPVSDCGVTDYHGGFVVSNVDFAFSDPNGEAPGCDDRLVLDGFPSDGVALHLMPTGVMETSSIPPTTLFPLSLDRFEGSGETGSGASESKQPIVIGGRLVGYVYAWIGASATAADRDQLADLVVSIAYRNALVGSVFIDEGDGFTVSVPEGWQVSDRPINTWVADPKEILALATYPLVPGGEAVTDGQVPSNAVDGLGPNDMFIWVSDRFGADASYPQRPISFSPEAICSSRETVCEQGRALGIEGIRSWWYYFRDGDRGLYVFVGMGERAFDDPARAQQAWDVLDSLTFEPTSAFATCPSTDDAVPPEPADGAAASDAARAFVRASTEGDDEALARLTDPAGIANHVAVTSTAADPVIGNTSAVNDVIVLGGCGSDVADDTWVVVVDDGTSSASMDVNLYLIKRSDGWRVWGAY